MTIIVTVIGIIAFAIAGPIIGCLLAGLDRIISARMQGRVGPPLLQPYYDVRKLFSKENASVNTSEHAYILFAFIFTLVAGGVFFSGGNLLLSVFLVTLSSLLFIVAAYSSRSPYSEVGAARETLQAMAYEPMLGLVEVMHWCENVLFMGWVAMFFIWSNPLSIVLAVVVVLAVYFLEIWIDNNFARVKWQLMLKSAWAVALVAGGLNVAVLAYL